MYADMYTFGFNVEDHLIFLEREVLYLMIYAMIFVCFLYPNFPW